MPDFNHLWVKAAKDDRLSIPSPPTQDVRQHDTKENDDDGEEQELFNAWAFKEKEDRDD